MVKKNRRPIFRNKRTGRPFIGKSKELRALEDELILKLRHFKNVCRIEKPINKDVYAVFFFYFPKDVFFTKKGFRSKNIPDLLSLLEGPCDCLQAAGIIEDDNLIDGLEQSRRLPGEEYLLEILIFNEKSTESDKQLEPRQSPRSLSN